MKNLSIKIAVITLFTFTMINTSFAQVTRTLMARAEATGILLAKSGYEYVSADAAILKKGKSYFGEIELSEGYEYVIIAISEKGIKDLDLYLYDSQGNELMKNTKRNDKGIVLLDFSVKNTEKFYIKAQNYKSKKRRKSYQVAIAIYQKPIVKNLYGYTTY